MPTKPKREPIPNSNGIILYMHCAQCIAEKPDDVTPMDWSRTQAGWTMLGIQVWCNRHDLNIMHVDFEGVQHPANTTARVVHEVVHPGNDDAGVV